MTPGSFYFDFFGGRSALLLPSNLILSAELDVGLSITPDPKIKCSVEHVILQPSAFVRSGHMLPNTDPDHWYWT